MALDRSRVEMALGGRDQFDEAMREQSGGVCEPRPREIAAPWGAKEEQWTPARLFPGEIHLRVSRRSSFAAVGGDDDPAVVSQFTGERSEPSRVGLDAVQAENDAAVPAFAPPDQRGRDAYGIVRRPNFGIG